MEVGERGVSAYRGEESRDSQYRDPDEAISYVERSTMSLTGCFAKYARNDMRLDKKTPGTSGSFFI
jgi:hypothetical protein